MAHRFIVFGAVAAALVLSAPASAHAWVFPFVEPAERLSASADELVALDFDGNGWPDIAGVRGLDARATLVLNGPEAFADAQTAGLGAAASVPVAVAGGDLDGDGRDELLATLGESGALVVFKGRASGGLGTPEVHTLRTPQGARATAVAVADVDGDGDRDVVAAFGDSASVLTNDGHGVLTPTAGAVTIPSPYDLKLVELAGDDDPDLVVLSGYTLTVLPGAAGAGFGAPVTQQLGDDGSALATGDVDGDGRSDVGVSYQWLNPYSTNPGFFSGTAGGGLAPVAGGAVVADALVLADFDGDGATDRYMAGSPSRFQHGVGAFGLLGSADSEESGWESALATADFDGDGKLDVASAGSSSPELLVRYSSGPQLVPDDSNTWFGEATVGAGGSMIAVPVRNEGGGIARNLELVTEGDKDDFEVDLYSCRGAVLAVDGQCWMRVYFRPKTTGDKVAEIGLVAEDSRLLWTVAVGGTAEPALPPADKDTGTPPIPVGTGLIRMLPRTVPLPPRSIKPVRVAIVRPGVPQLTRSTLATLRRSGLRFTQRFGTAERVTWTLEHRGTVLARATRLVASGSTRVTLTLTAAGKRQLAKRKPATLTLRTQGTLARVTTVKLRRG